MIKLNEKELLNEVFREFITIINWFPSGMESAYILYLKIETIINIIEVNNCGQIGGNYYKHPLPKEIASGYKLYDRFLKIVINYKLEDDIKFQSTGIWDLRDWYKKYESLKKEG